MGCQNSKLHADILAIPPKLRPILWRRFEELRSRRRNGVVGGTTISKKELLKDNKVYLLPSSIDENESSKSISMDDSVSSSVSRQKPEKTKPETMEETDNNQAIKEDKNEESYIEKVVKAEAVEKMVVVEEGGDEEEEEEEEEEERGNLGPGSPSFRVYFIEASLGEKDNVKNDSKDGKLCRAKSVDSIVLLETHEEDQETKTIKKRMKNRTRITRAICRGPVAVKHLLSVSSCYHPSNDRATLLTKKSAT